MKQIKKSFTLVELMIVIAILAILSAIVIFVLNPGRLFDNMRDIRRVTDITSIHKAINFMETWNTSMTYGTSTFVYISIPATNSNCSDIAGLPTLPAGYTYACSSQANYKKTDGTGWIPINFTVSSDNRYLSNLPVDPVNDNTYFYTYFPGGSYELTAMLSNPNKNSINDEGSLTSTFEIGSSDRTFVTPLQRDKGLMGYWKFNEGTGAIAYDSSGYGNNGILTNGPTWTTLGSGHKVLSFDGAGDYVNCGNDTSINFSELITIGIWINTSANNYYRRIVAKAIDSPFGNTDGWNITINDDLVFFNLGNDAGTGKHISTGNKNNGAWHYIVGRWDGFVMKIYANGSYVTETSYSSNILSTVNLIIGASSSVSATYSGFISDVRIYNRALSADEISQIYNATKSKYE